jgi:hypothetical protein
MTSHQTGSLPTSLERQYRAVSKSPHYFSIILFFQFNRDKFMYIFEEKIMIIRKQITDSSLNLRIPPKLSCPESAQLCQDLGSRETLKCFSTIYLDTMMKIIMASKPSSSILDPIPTKLLKELLPVLGPPMLHIINGASLEKTLTQKI